MASFWMMIPRQIQLALKGEQTRKLAERLDVLVRLVDNPLQVLRIKHVLSTPLVNQLQAAKFAALR
ncbi:MAG: hypothetical protein JO189_20555 [Deltaproteobacteria bacterium]|nr:hypothetical protein [Deltaproteobacteria bacterium]